MRRRLVLVVIVLVVAATAVVLSSRSAPDDGPAARARPARSATPAPARAVATPAAIRRTLRTRGLVEHLRALQRAATAHGGNRAAGTAGDRASVAYVAGRLRAAGLRTVLQPVSFPYFDERRRPRVQGVGAREAGTLIYSAAGTVTGPLRVAGGDGSPAQGCRPGDFAAVRDGDVVLVARGTCTLLAKAQRAQRAGAAAVLIVNGADETFAGTLQRPVLRVPVLGLSAGAGATLARRRGEPLRVSVDVVSENRTTRNVIAETGPRDARRVVMAGAHLDSVAQGPGLNDNGSGVAALLEVAEQLAQRRLPAGARMRFGFWGAEELGLIGSRRYVRRLSAARRREIAAYVNLDMVATPKADRAVYDARVAAEPARSASRRIEASLRRNLRRPAGRRTLRGASDHAPFLRAGIPVGGLFTGLDRCYHKACDTLATVDRGVLTEMARAAGASLVELARR